MDDEIPHSTGRNVVRGPRAPRAAAERIVSPIYDHEVIFEGVVVSRAYLERLTTERDAAQARADGYALLVKEYRRVLQAWSDADPLTGDLLREHFRAVLARREAILAAEDQPPETEPQIGELLGYVRIEQRDGRGLWWLRAGAGDYIAHFFTEHEAQRVARAVERAIVNEIDTLTTPDRPTEARAAELLAARGVGR